MNWFLILSDEGCKKELQQFLKQNPSSLLYKTETEEAIKNIERAMCAMNLKSEDRFITVNSSNNVHLLKVCEIMHCKSDQNYTQFNLSNGKKITSSKSLKETESILKPHQFTRIHQSHLVNINYIEKYVKGLGGYLILRDGTELPVAARKKEFLMRELENL